MKLLKTSVLKGNSGSTILATMLLATILLAAVAGVASYTSFTGINTFRARQVDSSLSAAEGVMEVMYARWRTAGRSNLGVPTDTEIQAINGTANAPSLTTYPNLADYTVTVHSLTPVNAYNATVVNPPPVVTAPLSGRPGWVARTSNYLGRVTTLSRVFQKADAPIFQAAIFYESVLEIHPGADMNITGLVHSNGDIYACPGPGTGHDLTFSRNVSYSNSYSEGFAPGDPRTQTIRPIYAAGSQLTNASRLEPLGTEPASIFNTTDQATNTNNDGFRELIERPGIGPDPAELSGIRFYNQAGLKILIDSTLKTTNAGRVKIYNRSGVQVTDTTVINAVKAAISSGESIQDNRESATMRLTSFDLSKIASITTAMGASTDLPTRTYNNIIYIADTSADPAGNANPKKAIRLRNGATLPSDLTIASENPVYIQGDYNTGGPTNTVPTNATSASSPITAFGDSDAPGYTRKSCAVLADAVNILSNNWNDTATTHLANNTTVNTAIFAGNVPTDYGGNGRYSGGAENFPRFLENWSGGINFSYYGSMVCMFRSLQAKGPWGNSNVYQPPNRRWFFDTNFLSNPPPGTLTSVTYSRGRWKVE
jgi:hypothetical protein